MRKRRRKRAHGYNGEFVIHAPDIQIRGRDASARYGLGNLLTLLGARRAFVSRTSKWGANVTARIQLEGHEREERPVVATC
jgi:hypothetical protein